MPPVSLFVSRRDGAGLVEEGRCRGERWLLSVRRDIVVVVVWLIDPRQARPWTPVLGHSVIDNDEDLGLPSCSPLPSADAAGCSWTRHHGPTMKRERQLTVAFRAALITALRLTAPVNALLAVRPMSVGARLDSPRAARGTCVRLAPLAALPAVENIVIRLCDGDGNSRMDFQTGITSKDALAWTRRLASHDAVRVRRSAPRLLPDRCQQCNANSM